MKQALGVGRKIPFYCVPNPLQGPSPCRSGQRRRRYDPVTEALPIVTGGEKINHALVDAKVYRF
jgi:hypothetical protein